MKETPQITRKLISLIVVAVVLATGLAIFSFGLIAFADHGPPGSHLVEVGPINPEHGFPIWYKDATGLALELCLDFTDPLCNFLPGDIPDPNSPLSFPDNFPGEAFWWTGDAIMDTDANGGSAALVLALEAAFLNEDPVDGDQISFGRVRIRIDTTVPGTYTVTHPYGTDVFNDVGTGPRAINLTEDIGIGAPGDFTGALDSRIGPFLTWDPITDAPPGFVGNPLFEHAVTGSPFGTNFFRVEGPVGSFTGSSFLCADPTLGADPIDTTDCIETDQFFIMGKIRTIAGVGAIRARYKNSTGPGPEGLDVWAFSEAGESLRVSGPNLVPTDMEGDGAGLYYARLEFDGSGPPPATITVTNIGDDPPSIVVVPVEDLITITEARYDTDTDELSVKATSSDEDSVPTLSVYDQDGNLLGSMVAGSTFTLTTVIPPVDVTVVSSHGGSAREPVIISGTPFGTANLPPDVTILAPPDGSSFGELDLIGFVGSATDSDDGPLSANLVWSSSIDGQIGTGSVFTTSLSVGVHTITAVVTDTGGLAGSDSIVISVLSANNTPPVANDDTAETSGIIPITFDILGNDTDSDGVIDPTTVEVGTALNGTVSVNPVTGEITYTPNTNTGASPVTVGPINPDNGFPVWHQGSGGFVGTGTDVFTYTVRDNQGAVSNVATVTVNRNPLTLQLCLDDVLLCGLLLAPPFDFPTYFPDEAFWWSAEALMPTNNGNDATLVLALGAAFVDDGPPAPGAQETFGRTRILADGLVPGATYTVTHPYGVNVLVADGAGSINFTVDEGGLPGDFAAAIGTLAGPFLVWDNTPPAPPAGYIGDPNIPHTITGSPFGFNFFRIEGPDVGGPGVNVVETDQFLVMGQIATLVAVNDALVTSEDTAVTADLIANDIPAPGLTIDGTSLSIVTPPVNGVLVNNGDGTVTYTPNPDFAGTDSFQYTVANNNGAVSNIATADITVTAVNDPPVANDDSTSTVEDTAVAINVLSNDTDIDGIIDPTTVVVVSGPANGTTAVDPSTGVITYTPSLGFNGVDTFTYTVNDDGGATSNQATVTITVSARPVAVDDTATTPENTPVGIPVTTNDFDPDGLIDPGTVAIVTGPASGSVVVNATGVVTYTPDISFVGVDTFTYTVNDNDGLVSNSATVTVTVTEANADPIAVDDTAITLENTSVSIPVTANDFDPDGAIDETSVAIASPPANGLTVVSVDGNTGQAIVTYTPNISFVGIDTFTYTVQDLQGAISNQATVTVTVNEANQPPIAVDDLATTNEDVPVVINVLTNDSDPDGSLDITSVAVIGGPSNGATSVNAVTGEVTYTPNLNFNGTDVFTYTVIDDQGALSNPATVTVTINAVNDPPVANDDNVTAVIETPITFNILTNDLDVDSPLDPASIVILAGPVNGSLSVNTTTGDVTYTPNPEFLGTDVFTYIISDDQGASSNIATVIIQVEDVIVVTDALFRTDRQEWRIRGSAPLSPAGDPVFVTIYIGPDLTGPVLATVEANNRGRWGFRDSNGMIPDFTGTISIETSEGDVLLGVLVTIQ